MVFKEKIESDAKSALREKDELKLSVLRLLLSAIHNKEIEKRSKTGKPEELTEEETAAVLRQEAKKRKDAFGEFEKAGRGDLAEKERAELKVLEEYLPKELSDAEIEKIVKETVKAGDSAKDFGRLMAEAMKRAGGRASGERVASAVKKELNASL